MNFDVAFWLVILTAITGLVTAAEHFWLSPKRTPEKTTDSKKNEPPTPPAFIELCVSLFPVILIVLVLRSFLVEPFRIPSGSMKPTLLVGDFILVNKYTFGIRLPVLNTKIIEINTPQRGDIIVFRYPKNPKINYIKRLIGRPGDIIRYENKILTVNGQTVALNTPQTYIENNGQRLQQWQENLQNAPHNILHNPQVNYPDISLVVPSNHYFVMGDNRDNSNDSRVWGFVPEANLVGKAFYIWMNWNNKKPGFPIDWPRIGTILQ